MIFKLIVIVATVHLLAQASDGGVLSIFWCGFDYDFCGQSRDDDVNSKATHVILAFANANSDGSINYDTSTADSGNNIIFYHSRKTHHLMAQCRKKSNNLSWWVVWTLDKRILECLIYAKFC